MSIAFRWGNLKKRNCLEDLGEDRRIILKDSSRNKSGRAWTRLIWARTGICAGVLPIAVIKTPMKRSKFRD